MPFSSLVAADELSLIMAQLDFDELSRVLPVCRDWQREAAGQIKSLLVLKTVTRRQRMHDRYAEAFGSHLKPSKFLLPGDADFIAGVRARRRFEARRTDLISRFGRIKAMTTIWCDKRLAVVLLFEYNLLVIGSDGRVWQHLQWNTALGYLLNMSIAHVRRKHVGIEQCVVVHVIQWEGPALLWALRIV